MVSLLSDQEEPSSPSLTSTLNTNSDSLTWADVPSPESYCHNTSQSTRMRSGSTTSMRYPQSHYPSPVDSNSSRGRRTRDIETTDTRGDQYGSSLMNTATVRPFVPSGIETESIEYIPLASQSSRYPRLHFLLARDSARANRFVLDLREDPQYGVSNQTLENFGTLWVTRDRPVHFRIISHHFPWVIDIQAEEPLGDAERGVTCGDVWNQLYSQLHEPLNNADWAYLSALSEYDETAHRRLNHLNTIARRPNPRGGAASLTRLDWLMGMVFFKGLEKDEGYRLSLHRILPGMEQCSETWIAYLSEHV